jgi:hypothetical protein
MSCLSCSTRWSAAFAVDTSSATIIFSPGEAVREFILFFFEFGEQIASYASFGARED